MEAFLVSTGIVALAEMGDKTQLLSLLLAARFRKPWPIVWGILVATLVNHGLAGAVGSWVTTQLGPEALRWVLGGGRYDFGHDAGQCARGLARRSHHPQNFAQVGPQNFCCGFCCACRLGFMGRACKH